MEWGSTKNQFEKVPETQGGQYEIEHILEWQVVTGFFDWLDKHFKGQKFPDPTGSNTIDFCTYFENTWGSQTFTIAENHPTATDAKDHLALQYPHSKKFEDEFVWLQKDINKPAKQNVLITFSTTFREKKTYQT